ncbi:condensation domain-containing protein [Amycolatopsis roodepoortensis]|uniref:Condensation domain-containing protein n=1 Tax=Amycolatopsis roodepoortensis TaxID=700274 RepID=A0ABR9L7E2_9PSEU|nr:condensation domain-containing protein [Amycolatopsis roodepoortensis]MBE1576302.1 hypothetical protein [Amycolatopsis roodepoortensis]
MSEVDETASRRYPLSHTQEFLCGFDDNVDADEGPFGPRYHNVRGWRLLGSVDIDLLRAALGDVVTRHEALRTVINRPSTDRYQEVRPPSPAGLEVVDVPDTGSEHRVEEFLGVVEAGTISAVRPPLLRAVLGRLSDEESLFVLVGHHIGTDGWSMRLLMRDIAEYYGARIEGREARLPEVRQYREFGVAQREASSSPAHERARAYWRDKLRDARLLGLPADAAVVPGPDKVTSTFRFVLDPGLTDATVRLARSSRASAFMVLQTAYNVLVARRTSATDIVVPTITSGRLDERFEETVGPFFNFLPLRTDLEGCVTLRDVLQRTRATCIEAQVNDIPFAHLVGEAPELPSTFATPGVAVSALQVFQHPFGADGELGATAKYAEVRHRVLGQAISSDIPNGMLWTLDVDAEHGIFGSVKYDRQEFREDTVAGLVEEFRAILSTVVTDADTPLSVEEAR